MTKEELIFLKETYDKSLAGTYDPAEMTKAYQLISGNDLPAHPSQKKRMLYAFVNYSYKNRMKEFEEVKDKPWGEITGTVIGGTEPIKKPLTCDQDLRAEGVVNHNPLEDQIVKVEEIVLTKPKATRKKRVTKIKKK